MLKKIIVGGLILILLIVVGVIGVVTMKKNATQRELELEAQARKDDLLKLQRFEDEQKDLYKTEVEDLLVELDVIVDQIKSGDISEENGKEKCCDLIRAATYGEDGFFWVDTLEGQLLVLNKNLNMEGQNRMAMQDSHGKYFIKDFIELAQSGGGFREYYFPNVGSEEPGRKLAYVKLYEPFSWVIGTGGYAAVQNVEDLEGN